MSIVTRTGDNGTTGLMFGQRVRKDDLRLEACGTVDELNAALGLARSSLADLAIGSAILSIQNDLVVLMGEVGVSAEDRGRYVEKGYGLVTSSMTQVVEALIQRIEQTGTVVAAGWAMPGATPAGATCDFARTVCRRAERRVVEVLEGTDSECVRYLNRLSDLCWLWARVADSGDLRGSEGIPTTPE